MANLDDAVNALLPVVNDLQPRMRSWLATAGDGRGNVIDTSNPNHVFVRVLNNAVGTAPSVQTISVFNDLTLLADGDRCVVGFGPERPRLLRVLARQDQRYDTATGGTIIGGTNLGVLPHAWQHAWLAPDPVFIDFFQVINLAVYPAGGLSVAIQRGLIPRIGVDTLVDHQVLDLTGYVPASGARWALLSVKSDGTIAVTTSATVGSRINLDYTLIPDTPVGNFRLAAVALYSGQTDIILATTQQDIFDLRWPQERLTGAIAPSDIALTDGHLLIGQTTGQAADKAMSNDATIDHDGVVTLKTVNANVGTFGDATHVAQVTFDAKGRATAAANVPIANVGKYRQFVVSISGGDFQFVKTSDGFPVTVLLSLE